MTVFADYSFYVNKYLAGKSADVSAADFPYYVRKSTQEIKCYTGSNIDENNIPECVKMCCCEIADIIFSVEKSEQQTSGKTSESVQGWSASYESRDQAMQFMQNKIRSSVYSWLSGTGLLYRGLR